MCDIHPGVATASASMHDDYILQATHGAVNCTTTTPPTKNNELFHTDRLCTFISAKFRKSDLCPTCLLLHVKSRSTKLSS